MPFARVPYTCPIGSMLPPRALQACPIHNWSPLRCMYTTVIPVTVISIISPFSGSRAPYEGQNDTHRPTINKEGLGASSLKSE